MDTVLKQASYLMTNYENMHDSDSLTPDEKYIHSRAYGKHKGGADTHAPTGGFPPIYRCTGKTQPKQAKPEQRTYATNTTSVSIKDIMRRRREQQRVHLTT